MEYKNYTANDVRSLLGASIEALLAGSINPERANAVANLASEMHTSVQQEFQNRMLLLETCSFKERELIAPLMYLEPTTEEVDEVAE